MSAARGLSAIGSELLLQPAALCVLPAPIVAPGAADRVTGEAWFDHEWSSEYLDAEAVGLGLDRRQLRLTARR